MLYLVLRFNIRLCESHNHSHTVDITLYNTVFPMPHIEEANEIIVIVIVIVIGRKGEGDQNGRGGEGSKRKGDRACEVLPLQKGGMGGWRQGFSHAERGGGQKELEVVAILKGGVTSFHPLKHKMFYPVLTLSGLEGAQKASDPRFCSPLLLINDRSLGRNTRSQTGKGRL